MSTRNSCEDLLTSPGESLLQTAIVASTSARRKCQGSVVCRYYIIELCANIVLLVKWLLTANAAFFTAITFPVVLKNYHRKRMVEPVSGNILVANAIDSSQILFSNIGPG